MSSNPKFEILTKTMCCSWKTTYLVLLHNEYFWYFRFYKYYNSSITDKSSSTILQIVYSSKFWMQDFYFWIIPLLNFSGVFNLNNCLKLKSKKYPTFYKKAVQEMTFVAECCFFFFPTLMVSWQVYLVTHWRGPIPGLGTTLQHSLTGYKYKTSSARPASTVKGYLCINSERILP